MRRGGEILNRELEAIRCHANACAMFPGRSGAPERWKETDAVDDSSLRGRPPKIRHQ